jgi:hypothetical protein
MRMSSWTKIRQAASGAGALERKRPVVIERRLGNSLFERELAAQFQRMLSHGAAVQLAQSIVIAAENVAGDCLAECESAGNRDLGQRFDALNAEFGA